MNFNKYSRTCIPKMEEELKKKEQLASLKIVELLNYVSYHTLIKATKQRQDWYNKKNNNLTPPKNE